MKNKHKKYVKKVLKDLEGKPEDVALTVAINIIDVLMHTHPRETESFVSSVMVEHMLRSHPQPISVNKSEVN